MVLVKIELSAGSRPAHADPKSRIAPGRMSCEYLRSRLHRQKRRHTDDRWRLDQPARLLCVCSCRNAERVAEAESESTPLELKATIVEPGRRRSAIVPPENNRVPAKAADADRLGQERSHLTGRWIPSVQARFEES